MTTRLIATTIEPLTIAQIKQRCRIDTTGGEPAPLAISSVALSSPATAGNVDNGQHRYLVTFITASGETEAGIASAPVTVANKAVNGQVRLTGIPTGGAAVTSRKLYRTAAGGSLYLYVATIADNASTTYSDNLADSNLGVQAPTINTTDDPTLVSLLAAARGACEQEVCRSLALATWELKLDAFPDDIPLNWPPILTVEEVSYIDPDGATQILDPAAYALDNASEPGWVLRAFESEWPETQDVANALTVRYTAGYGLSCPEELKQWICLQVGNWYKNLEATSERALVVNPYAEGLLSRHRIYERP